MFGARIPFDPHNLISRDELRDLFSQRQPDASPGQVEASIEHVYSVFLERLLGLMFPYRSPSPIEAEAVTRWVADRWGDEVTDSTAVANALQRHASMLPSAVPSAVDGAESVANTEQSWGSDEDTEGEGIDPDGQTLQRTLYHIAEDRARQEGVVHRGITCNGCDEKPIRGIRWHCANCADYDLCSNCEATNGHIKTHIFYKIRVPAPYLGTAKLEPLYPGKPHMMSPSVNASLKKRLVAETKMEAEEIDALWDQFTCLAGTEWLADPSNTGWALDRRAFNHAFIPRYNSFIAAPNLVYDRIFAYYDSDKNGLIGFEEWIKGLDGMHSSHIKSRIVFDAYDVDGDGYISRKDILRIFRAYYAIEKEATRNYVAEITEELSVRNALETIRSSQPLGSAFSPHGPSSRQDENSRLQHKNEHDLGGATVVYDEVPDMADREEILQTVGEQNASRQGLVHDEQDRIVDGRWSRRQFYVDEEEGLSRPQAMKDDTPSEDDDAIDATEHTEELGSPREDVQAPPRCSRSSSRVRFEDDVDLETRSNASTSSRPVGERWGGYEIPEPEKDLGKEVLYQITQQGFNELLDPMFEERENNAMDAHATRAERRQCAEAIEEITHRFRNKKRGILRAICMIGIFRYSMAIIESFCDAVNESPNHGRFRACFHDTSGMSIGEREARKRLLRVYSAVEEALLDAVIAPVEYTVDDTCLWNIWLCQDRLRNEVLAACLDAAMHFGWIEDQSQWDQPLHDTTPVSTIVPSHRDPTMPQFKPNSFVELLAPSQSTSSEEPRTGTEAVASYQQTQSQICPAPYADNDGIRSQSESPCFVYYDPQLIFNKNSDETVLEANAPSTSQGLATSQSVIEVQLLIDQPPVPTEDIVRDDHDAKWLKYKNDSVMHALSVRTSEQNELIEILPQKVTHSDNPYHIGLDQSKPLYQKVRELAMDPASESHAVLLASLEAVQQENYKRKGNGLINFEEFDEHMREGKLRFLESWMEWVSI
ncbi:hypothetical protein EK21DRAFT_103811 [Setomelanomma holmii]|uniref:Uncharacterized protein n=1 Tax=Setomelanomma holmii TaxID=210430 RepID=A0A9P4H0Y6_9PLEO|nr:hypothetical protein EK21DRAFT_103811 [Setomelanomma holmii]